LLRTLTDPRLAAGQQPFDQPTLGSQNGRLVQTVGTGDFTAIGQLVATAPFAPRLGESWFRLTLTGASIGAPTFLMWDTAVGTGAPFGIELGMTPDFQVFGTGTAEPGMTMATGAKQVPLPLPNNPSLSGMTLFAQWLVLEPSRTGPLATSNALQMTLR
jgi:hypothetical protein